MPPAVSVTVVLQAWRHGLHTQGCAERHVWCCACRDPVRMGALPAHGLAASRHAALYAMACLEQGARPRAFGSMPAALARVLPQTADCLLRTGRSEERRVGQECRSRWSADHYKKQLL